MARSHSSSSSDLLTGVRVDPHQNISAKTSKHTETGSKSADPNRDAMAAPNATAISTKDRARRIFGRSEAKVMPTTLRQRFTTDSRATAGHDRGNVGPAPRAQKGGADTKRNTPKAWPPVFPPGATPHPTPNTTDPQGGRVMPGMGINTLPRKRRP